MSGLPPGLFLVFVVSTPAIATADVRISETLSEKVERSAVVARAKFVDLEPDPKISNPHPRTAHVRVTRALRGCKEGDLLSVQLWNVDEPHRLDGTNLLVFLGDRPSKTGGVSLSRAGHVVFPDCVISPDERTVEMVVGFVTFRVDVSLPEEIHLPLGKELFVKWTVTNESSESAPFNLTSWWRLTTTNPRNEDITNRAPTTTADFVYLKPGEHGTVTSNLSKLFPNVFTTAGDYWVQLSLPARGGERIARHVEIFEASLAYACAHAAVVLRAHVRPVCCDTHKATIEDAIHLRQRGERLQQYVKWPDDAPVAPTNRLIVCATPPDVFWIERDTPEARDRIRQLVSTDPDAWWPRDEDRDPRFAVSADLPASEQRRTSLDKRLSTP